MNAVEEVELSHYNHWSAMDFSIMNTEAV